MSERLPKSAFLLHGFLRTGASMWPMKRALQQAGYRKLVSPTYFYQFRSISEVAAELAPQLVHAAEATGEPVDIVTHSYGGLIARAVLPLAPVRRVVMLAPPNQGAKIAEIARKTLPVHHLGWDPLRDVLPGVPSELPTTPAEIAIITGGSGNERGFNPLLGADNDQTVRVDEAYLDGARAFRVLRRRHSFLMFDAEVQKLTLAFLRHGAFPD